MYRYRRRGRHAAKRPDPRPQALPSGESVLVAGAGVVLVGFFSVKQKDHAALMTAAEADLASRGVRVLARAVQRRGASDGGVRNMSRPFSPRTLIRMGKAREVAAAREEAGADAVVFVNPLTEHQRGVLSDLFGCPAISLAQP
ncbi:hypothetical protein LG634_03830 [Streptomyces bambusae]|uniref:hypothetical protein n=1 Tax=Streptomyces bambusae TaxID=1550616 RepID=UPI001CFF162D|nr:hypothetical protein [Streptomyces bambusae]MCB5163966.1 hypothetical protein [Streptomyces bambusae]